MAKFAIITLGCKVNQCESAVFENALVCAGLREAGPEEAADICIVNTCAVTAKAAMQSRQACRQLVRHHPGAKIVVTGCYAEIAAEELKKIQGVHQVVARTEKPLTASSALSLLTDGSSSPPTLLPSHNEEFFPVLAKPAGGRTRPFLKVQDGCDAFCTYCIVPHARGRSKSLDPEQVISNLLDFKRLGYHEVVLTGIHLGWYGRDLSPKTDLYALLVRVIASGAMDRVRLSSIEPMEVTRELIALAAGTDRICPHFHIPLQSGDNAVLKRMHRPYTREAFAERVSMIKEWMPHAAVGVDVMAGFPGESEAGFENTRRLLEDLPISYLHVFPFSPRKGTPAATFPDAVSPQIAKARCAILRRLSQEKRKRFHLEQLDRVLRVLVEREDGVTLGESKGISDNYVHVRFSPKAPADNPFVRVRVTRVDGNLGVWGNPV
jgi:threonylcarbamoyladenosine tRNA methylthiotransferase MtaB